MSYNKITLSIMLMMCFALFPSCRHNKEDSNKPRGILLGFMSATTEIGSHKSKASILPFAIYENGKYIAVNCPCDDKEKLSDSCTTALKSRTFYVINNGQTGIPHKVFAARVEDFGCENLASAIITYKPADKEYENELKDVMEARRKNNDKDPLKELHFSRTAISYETDGKLKVQPSPINSKVTLNLEQQKYIRDMARKIFSKNTAIFDSTLEIESTEMADLDHDNKPEYFSTVFASDSLSYTSCLIAYHLNNNKIDTINTISEYDMDFTQLEAFDIDGDGNAEMIIYKSGHDFETSVMIYSYKYGILKKEFETSLFGC